MFNVSKYNISSRINMTTLVSFVGNNLRTNWTGWVGFTFTVGQINMSVTHLGRYFTVGSGGNITSAIHTSAGVMLASATIVATTNDWSYTPLSIPLVLNSGNSYFMASLETNGNANNWYDSLAVSEWVPDITNIKDGYTGPSPFTSVGTRGFINNSYGPPNFKYYL